ncbi:hypothetical protein RSOLAG1IB_08037 [Rhizoctonia solani AG-1 IB]|uniref:Uncharacterized protein n=1 Tax=Thanatephorus cucumeris (strain AG1-IB / isolate 7/3/14) TaxID=1108050 RepID=A0A0B7FFB1_THACB|nr:hypothetical protein RSOLAG1IB_08037 [Rhizoctonia solani AG-1 IB]
MRYGGLRFDTLGVVTLILTDTTVDNAAMRQCVAFSYISLEAPPPVAFCLNLKDIAAAWNLKELPSLL